MPIGEFQLHLFQDRILHHFALRHGSLIAVAPHLSGRVVVRTHLLDGGLNRGGRRRAIATRPAASAHPGPRTAGGVRHVNHGGARLRQVQDSLRYRSHASLSRRAATLLSPPSARQNWSQKWQPEAISDTISQILKAELSAEQFFLKMLYFCTGHSPYQISMASHTRSSRLHLRHDVQDLDLSSSKLLKSHG